MPAEAGAPAGGLLASCAGMAIAIITDIIIASTRTQYPSRLRRTHSAIRNARLSNRTKMLAGKAMYL